MADVGVADGQASHLLVGGKLVVRDGELLAGDVEQIKTEAHAQAPALWGRMKALA